MPMEDSLLELDEKTAASDAADPLLEELVNDALGPFADALPEEELADQRAFLLLFFTTHPVAAPIVRSLRAKALAGAKSSVVTNEDASTEPESAAPGVAAPGAAGRRR